MLGRRGLVKTFALGLAAPGGRPLGAGGMRADGAHRRGTPGFILPPCAVTISISSDRSVDGAAIIRRFGFTKQTVPLRLPM